MPELDDTNDTSVDDSFSETLVSRPAKQLQHNIENLLAHMQIDTSTSAVTVSLDNYFEFQNENFGQCI